MPKFAIAATLDIAPGRRDEFLSLLMAHKARCLKDEPGTIQFEVLRPLDENTKVMLHEVYRDEAAFDAHSEGASITRLRKEATGMVVSRSLTRCTLLD